MFSFVNFQLITLLTTRPADVRDVHGVKVSTRILEQLTPHEVRDLRTVFEIFDTNTDGYVFSHTHTQAYLSSP